MNCCCLQLTHILKPPRRGTDVVNNKGKESEKIEEEKKRTDWENWTPNVSGFEHPPVEIISRRMNEIRAAQKADDAAYMANKRSERHLLTTISYPAGSEVDAIIINASGPGAKRSATLRRLIVAGASKVDEIESLERAVKMWMQLAIQLDHENLHHNTNQYVDLCSLCESSEYVRVEDRGHL